MRARVKKERKRKRKTRPSNTYQITAPRLRRATATTRIRLHTTLNPFATPQCSNLHVPDFPSALLSLPYTTLVYLHLFRRRPFIVEGRFLGKHQTYRKPLRQELAKVAFLPILFQPRPVTHTVNNIVHCMSHQDHISTLYRTSCAGIRASSHTLQSSAALDPSLLHREDDREHSMHSRGGCLKETRV